MRSSWTCAQIIHDQGLAGVLGLKRLNQRRDCRTRHFAVLLMDLVFHLGDLASCSSWLLTMLSGPSQPARDEDVGSPERRRPGRRTAAQRREACPIGPSSGSPCSVVSKEEPVRIAGLSHLLGGHLQRLAGRHFKDGRRTHL